MIEKRSHAVPIARFFTISRLDGFFTGWQENQFSYTWVRDSVILPAKNFSGMRLSQDVQEELFSRMKLLWQVPSHRLHFSHEPLSLKAFAEEASSHFQLPHTDLIASSSMKISLSIRLQKQKSLRKIF